MDIRRTPTEFIITIPASSDIDDVQDFLNYLRYKELTSRFVVPQSDQLSEEINRAHWQQHKARKR